MKTVLRAATIALITASGLTGAQAADLLMDPPPPVYEPEEVSYGAGFLEGQIGKSTDRDADKEETRWSLRGSHAVGFSNGINVQADAEYKFDQSCCKEDSTLAGTGHVFYRDPNSFAVGGYGHLANKEDIRGKQEDLYAYGIEGAAFLGNVTLLGALGTGTVYTETNEFDTTMGKIEGRYYVNDNLRFDATFAMDDTKLINAKQSSTHFGLRANWRLEEIPVTLFAGYRYEQQDSELGGIKLDPQTNDVIYVGARFNWGSTSMKNEERHGVLWDPNGAVGD